MTTAMHFIRAFAEMQNVLTKQGAIPVGNTPGEFAAFIKSETVKYTGVIGEAGIKTE